MATPPGTLDASRVPAEFRDPVEPTVQPPTSESPSAPPAEDPERQRLSSELDRFGREQLKWNDERRGYEERLRSTGEVTKTQIKSALLSRDPDAALADLGLSADERAMIARNVAIRHAPADKVPPELRAEAADSQLRSELANLRKDLEDEKRSRSEERAQNQARVDGERAMSALNNALGTGDDLVARRHKARPERVVRDAMDLGREMIAAGELSPQLDAATVSRKIREKLSKQYAEEFGITAGPVVPEKKSPEVKAVTPGISRGTNGATSPPPGPMSFDQQVDEWAGGLRAHRAQNGTARE